MRDLLILAMELRNNCNECIKTRGIKNKKYENCDKSMTTSIRKYQSYHFQQKAFLLETFCTLFIHNPFWLNGIYRTY